MDGRERNHGIGLVSIGRTVLITMKATAFFGKGTAIEEQQD
jgi:hypothetical protein